MTEELTAAHLRELGNLIAGVSAEERERMYVKAADYVRRHSAYVVPADVEKVVDMFREVYPNRPIPDLVRSGGGGLSKQPASPYVSYVVPAMAIASAAAVALLVFLAYSIAKRRSRPAGGPEMEPHLAPAPKAAHAPVVSHDPAVAGATAVQKIEKLVDAYNRESTDLLDKLGMLRTRSDPKFQELIKAEKDISEIKKIDIPVSSALCEKMKTNLMMFKTDALNGEAYTRQHMLTMLANTKSLASMVESLQGNDAGLAIVHLKRLQLDIPEEGISALGRIEMLTQSLELFVNELTKIFGELPKVHICTEKWTECTSDIKELGRIAASLKAHIAQYKEAEAEIKLIISKLEPKAPS